MEANLKKHKSEHVQSKKHQNWLNPNLLPQKEKIYWESEVDCEYGASVIMKNLKKHMSSPTHHDGVDKHICDCGKQYISK